MCQACRVHKCRHDGLGAIHATMPGTQWLVRRFKWVYLLTTVCDVRPGSLESCCREAVQLSVQPCWGTCTGHAAIMQGLPAWS